MAKQTARRDFQCKVFDDKIYVGGLDEVGSPTSTVAVYDPVINAWTALSSMSTTRDLFEAEVIQEKVFAIGGMTNTEKGRKFLSSVEIYDPNTNVWSEPSSMSVARCDLQTEVIDGNIYAISGRLDLTTYLATAEVLDAFTPEPVEDGKALLNIYMMDGTFKEYDLTMSKVNEFIE